MKNLLQKYIKENLLLEKKKASFVISKKRVFYDEEVELQNDSDKQAQVLSSNISEYVEQKERYSDFQTMLFHFIDERNLKDSDVYNKVHIDRRLFSKIRSDKNYHPSKETILLLGFALELNEEENVRLLDSASYSLPKNNYYDLIIRFCFIHKIYKLTEVNELLEEYHCKLFSY